jgi:hypothetical protein
VGNHNVLHHSHKDFCRLVDRRADIPVDFIMTEKIKIEDDEPDYRYWDFRDEIMQVEKMRTIGGKNGKEEKEKSKKTSNTAGEDQETA